MGKTRYVYSPALGRRVAVEALRTSEQPPRQKRKPFKVNWFKHPTWWVEVMRDASAGAHLLASIILIEDFRCEYTKGDIVLSSEMTGMSQTTRRRAVKELVELGLITVKQIGNEAPLVVTVHKRQGAKNGA